MTKEGKRILLQAVLFIVTFITTTLAGAEWAYSKSIFLTDYTWSDFVSGMSFSVPLLLVLTVHEFGHYFTALYHKVKTSLPYYIPIPPIPLLFSIGTFGAVIRLRTKPHSNLQHFDIGIAGPLAGFVVAVMLLIYGFSTLPPADYIFQFHPEYKQFGLDYANHVYDPEFQSGKNILDLSIGKNLLFLIAEQFVDDPSRIPNTHELMHYPMLLGVFFALFFTSLNLLPIGQLDGGHIMYGLVGYKKHKVIASVFFVALMFYAGLGNPYIKLNLPPLDLLRNTLLYIGFLYLAFTGLGLQARMTFMYVLLLVAVQFLLMLLLPGVEGYSGWLLLGLLIGRMVGISHPPSDIEQPLDQNRILLGWIALIVFILCFTPAPLQASFVTE